MAKRTRSLAERTNVTVFGAGVSGLTVAHELVERGFRVQVWEPQGDDRFPWRGCDVGGLARTQWSRAHWPEWRDRTSEAFPRVGKLPYAVRWKSDGAIEVSGPSALGLNGVEPLLARIEKDTALDAEPIIDVYLRAVGALSDDSKKMEAEIQQALSRFQREFLGTHAAVTQEEVTLLLHRKSGRILKFRVQTRSERSHRQQLLPNVDWRLEFYSRPVWGVQTEPLLHLPQVFYQLDDGKDYVLGATGNDDKAQATEEIRTLLAASPGVEQVYVEVYRRQDSPRDSVVAAEDLSFALEVLQKITKQDYLKAPVQWESADGPDRYDVAAEFDGRIVDLTLVRLGPLPDNSRPDAKFRVSFRVRERWFPGEHGYRFFPAFYHHLFDTMDRTPILQAAEKSPLAAAQERATRVNAEPVVFSETDRTPRDNIVERPFTIVPIAGQSKPAEVSRALPNSFEELRERLELFLNDKTDGGFGSSSRELNQFFLPYLRHLTSCESRRQTYEEMSWFEFAGGANFSPHAQETLMRLPKALVAMDARESDARTIGEVGTQLLSDQFMQTGYRDGALNGPTSVAWLEHWRRYLEAQGVEFIHGALESLELLEAPDGSKTIWPNVTCFEPRNIPLDDEGNPEPSPLLAGYYVLALPIVVLKAIAKQFAEDFPGEWTHRDLAAVHKLELGEPKEPEPKGEYKHFAGLQYYFAEDIFWADGHAYYPESPWAVTSISQTRRWTDRPDWEHGYRGILSTIIGKWDQPGLLVTKNAWDCTADELAKEVWHQISSAMTSKGKLKMPQPLYWHLDDSFRETGKDGTHSWTNIYPYQVQAPGRWKKRPGDLRDGSDENGAGYATDYGLVLAGTYMKTHTRITSMEAANESGRHAVNAILKEFNGVDGLRTTPCEIWPLIDREYRDFKMWKELDEILFERNLPHVMDILGVEFFASNGFRGGLDDPFNPTWILRQFSRFGSGGLWNAYENWFSRARRGG